MHASLFELVEPVYPIWMFIISPLCSWILFSSSWSQAQSKYKAQNIKKFS